MIAIPILSLMEENNSNDSIDLLMARFYTATLVGVSLVRFKICFADVYLLNASALTWRGRISQ